MIKIYQWNDIEAEFNDDLLLGNGASVAIDNTFSYGSLFIEATNLGHITAPVKDIFDRFGIDDFELVLRRLWQAKQVNQALGIPPGRIENAYDEVRDSLISTVHDVHVSYADATPHLEPIYNFLKRFDVVVSLNYDLILYWAAMLGNRTLGNWFKDGFLPREFNEDWEDLLAPYKAAGTTLFFYPHGNLVLSRNLSSQEEKIVVGLGTDLLDEIIDKWSSGANVPLFVCEGTSSHKYNAIKMSNYLNIVYKEVLTSLGDTLVIYGWSMSGQDDHILDQIEKSDVKRVAVSVYGHSSAYITHAEGKLRSIGIHDITFYDSSSAGCWNNT